MTKSAVFCRLGHISWKNPQWKNSFFVQCYIWLSVCLYVCLYICLSVCLHVSMIVILYVCLSLFVTVFLKSLSFSLPAFSSLLFLSTLLVSAVHPGCTSLLGRVYKLIFYISFLSIQYFTYKFFGYKSFLGYTSFVYTSFLVYKLIGCTRAYKLIVHPGYTSLLFILLIENSNLSSPRTTNPIEVLHFHCFWKTIFT